MDDELKELLLDQPKEWLVDLILEGYLRPKAIKKECQKLLESNHATARQLVEAPFPPFSTYAAWVDQVRSRWDQAFQLPDLDRQQQGKLLAAIAKSARWSLLGYLHENLYRGNWNSASSIAKAYYQAFKALEQLKLSLPQPYHYWAAGDNYEVLGDLLHPLQEFFLATSSISWKECLDLLKEMSSTLQLVDLKGSLASLEEMLSHADWILFARKYDISESLFQEYSPAELAWRLMENPSFFNMERMNELYQAFRDPEILYLYARQLDKHWCEPEATALFERILYEEMPALGMIPSAGFVEDLQKRYTDEEKEKKLLLHALQVLNHFPDGLLHRLRELLPEDEWQQLIDQNRQRLLADPTSHLELLLLQENASQVLSFITDPQSGPGQLSEQLQLFQSVKQELKDLDTDTLVDFYIDLVRQNYPKARTAPGYRQIATLLAQISQSRPLAAEQLADQIIRDRPSNRSFQKILRESGLSAK